MKCPHCGEEVPYENVKFCPNCGKSLVVKKKTGKTDLVLVTAMLTIMSAAFSAGLGYIAFDRYIVFAFSGSSELGAIAGFLIVGILSIVGAVVGIIAGMFILEKKNVNLSMLGVILLLVSAFGNYVTLYCYKAQYSQQYGFMEIAMFCEITIFIFAILSALYLTKTKAEFV